MRSRILWCRIFPTLITVIFAVSCDSPCSEGLDSGEYGFDPGVGGEVFASKPELISSIRLFVATGNCWYSLTYLEKNSREIAELKDSTANDFILALTDVSASSDVEGQKGNERLYVVIFLTNGERCILRCRQVDPQMILVKGIHGWWYIDDSESRIWSAYASGEK